MATYLLAFQRLDIDGETWGLNDLWFKGLRIISLVVSSTFAVGGMLWLFWSQKTTGLNSLEKQVSQENER